MFEYVVRYFSYFLCMAKPIFYTTMQLNLQRIQFSNIQGQEGIPWLIGDKNSQ